MNVYCSYLKYLAPNSTSSTWLWVKTMLVNIKIDGTRMFIQIWWFRFCSVPISYIPPGIIWTKSNTDVSHSIHIQSLLSPIIPIESRQTSNVYCLWNSHYISFKSHEITIKIPWNPHSNAPTFLVLPWVSGPKVVAALSICSTVAPSSKTILAFSWEKKVADFYDLW